MKNAIIIVFLTSVVFFAKGQTEIKLNLASSCSWDGKALNKTYFKYATNDDGLEIVNVIVNAVGLQPNFSVIASDIPNALATMDNGERIVFYNPDFFRNVDLTTNTNWSSLSILAHEIGHHLNGHPLLNGNARHHDELEADEFSGFVLHKLGASLEEAQSAAQRFLPSYATASHPPKSERLDAIKRGWLKDEPETSKDFADLLHSLPRVIKATPFNTYLHNADGGGEITLNIKNDMLMVSGNLDFKIRSDDVSITKLNGRFTGEYHFNQQEMWGEFPYRLRVDLNGNIEYIKRNTIYHDAFQSVFILIEGPNFFRARLEHESYDLDLAFILCGFSLN